MAGRAGVVVVGSFNVDHVWRCAELPPPGATLAGDYASSAGGKGFNQAIAAARAGARTTFVCALGEDAGGRQARALAAADHLDLRAARSDAPTGTAGIFVDARGRNSIVIGAGANATLSPGFVAAQDDATAAAAVVLAQLESPVAAVAQALRGARAAGAIAILNPAPANAPTSPGLLALADILTPNESEFAALLARHADFRIDPAALAGSEDAGLHALARRLLPHGTVVLTLGASGLLVSHPPSATRGDARDCYRLAAEAADVVDTTGAGDACNGALAAALALHPQRAFREHAVFANRYAALSTERAGAAAAMPSLTCFRARHRGD
ncbi:PfkB family carbohydrate kinase [Luteimonas sp. 50]|uniref:Ribokinase n=1 Tax=Cognatiluteimonas sedimenti TaxID=2927791 RepID=A0ABT0A3D6_9GAMM|nr:PfkB family carbohydrate kinase [Lysobacter sedimenti]MCJ0825471.1 PfkB family carbohydrate kinase [Lysobacter sedimenti]